MHRCPACETPFPGPAWTCPACDFAPPTQDGLRLFAPDMAEGFEAVYFAQLAQAEPGNFGFEGRNRLVLHLLRRVGLTRGDFLEIGCGTGFVLTAIARALPGLCLTASEIFPEGLVYARDRVPSATFYQMDARRVPFVGAFDGVGLFDVLEHIPEDEAVLAQVYAALQPGGWLLLSVPQHPFLWSIQDEVSHHQRRYTRAALHAKLRAAGFTVRHSTSFTSLLLPLMLISRLSAPPSADDYDPMTEFKLSPLVNRALGGVMQAEHGLHRLGVPLPWGGSRVVVAQRD